jgi:hypothetical protein
LNIVKKTKIYESTVPITEVGGSFSDLSLWIFWLESGTLMAKVLFKQEVVNVDGMYQGSLSSGRWTAPTELTADSEADSSPALLMSDTRVNCVVWSRDGRLYIAPTTVKGDIISIQIPYKNELSASATVALDNTNGKYSKYDGTWEPFFENEKAVEIWQGYNGDLVRTFTGHVKTTTADEDVDNATFTVELENKYASLIALTMTKRYKATFPTSPLTVMIEDFEPDESIDGAVENDDGTYAYTAMDLKIETAAGQRWYPGTPVVDSITGVADAEKANLQILGPFGSSETVTFVRIVNKNTSSVKPKLNIAAVDCSDLSIKVYSGSLTINQGDASVEQYYIFSTDDNDVNVAPESYQIITASDGILYKILEWILKLIIGSDFTAAVNLYDPTANGVGVQVMFYDLAGAAINAPLTTTINFDIYARPLTQSSESGLYVSTNFGTYPTPRELLFDLAKQTTRKDLLIGNSSDLEDDDQKLEAGVYKKVVTVQIEEKFDINTLRIENTSEDKNIICSILQTYSETTNGTEAWYADIAITRAYTSLKETSFSFEIWGQYTGRNDFYMPFYLDIPDTIADTAYESELPVIDRTVEDTINKVLQTCLALDDMKHRICFGANGHGAIRKYTIDDPIMTIEANLDKSQRLRETPDVIDRLAVKGMTTADYVQSTKEEVIHDQSGSWAKVPGGSPHNKITIEFDKSYLKSSLRLVTIDTRRAHVELYKATTTYCIVRIHNDSKSWYGKNNTKTGYVKFILYGVPLVEVTYQQDLTYKTTPGTSGKYNHVEKEVNNELISTSAMAQKIATSMILDSANKQLYYTKSNLPANPALEIHDTVQIDFPRQGITKAIIATEITTTFDASGGDGVKYLMSITGYPFDRFVTGLFSEYIEVDDNYEIDSNTYVKSRADISVLLNLLFG